MSDPDGHLQIVRQSNGWQDRRRSYDVLVDGSPVAQLDRGESATVPLTPGEYEIQLRIDGTWGSRRLTVEIAPGQMVRLRCWPGAGLRALLPWYPAFNRSTWIGLAHID